MRSITLEQLAERQFRLAEQQYDPLVPKSLIIFKTIDQHGESTNLW
jgi:hypothetical protein